jgi:hypothetical protein
MAHVFPSHHVAPSRPQRPEGIDIPLDLLGKQPTGKRQEVVIKHERLADIIPSYQHGRERAFRSRKDSEGGRPRGLDTLGWV